jgi:hypothetical protein
MSIQQKPTVTTGLLRPMVRNQLDIDSAPCTDLLSENLTLILEPFWKKGTPNQMQDISLEMEMDHYEKLGICLPSFTEKKFAILSQYYLDFVSIMYLSF